MAIAIFLVLAMVGCASVPKDAEGKRRLATRLHKEGVGCLQSGDPRKALDRFRRSSGVDDSYLPCRRDLGILLYRLAEKYEDDALESEEESSLLKDRGESEQARSAQERARKAHADAIPLLEEARSHLDVVNREYPDDPQVLSALGRVHAFRGEFRDARDYFLQGATVATDEATRQRFEALVKVCDQEIATR